MENLEHVKPQSKREPKSQCGVLADRAPPSYHHQVLGGLSRLDSPSVIYLKHLLQR